MNSMDFFQIYPRMLWQNSQKSPFIFFILQKKSDWSNPCAIVAEIPLQIPKVIAEGMLREVIERICKLTPIEIYRKKSS